MSDSESEEEEEEEEEAFISYPEITFSGGFRRRAHCCSGNRRRRQSRNKHDDGGEGNFGRGRKRGGEGGVMRLPGIPFYLTAPWCRGVGRRRGGGVIFGVGVAQAIAETKHTRANLPLCPSLPLLLAKKSFFSCAI